MLGKKLRPIAHSIVGKGTAIQINKTGHRPEEGSMAEKKREERERCTKTVSAGRGGCVIGGGGIA